MLLIDLNGKWQVKRTDESNWLDAVVPGSVYNDLLQAELIEDPFYRDNEYKSFEISKFDFEYKKCFIAEESVLEKDKIVLLCEGLDTLCEIFINGIRIISTDNMHRIYEY